MTPGTGKDGYSISEFLTKMAQGEHVDVDSFISGGERKRRKLSEGMTAAAAGVTAMTAGYDPSTGGMFDTPQPRAKDPWSAEQSPAVPDLLSWVSVSWILRPSLVTEVDKGHTTNGQNPESVYIDNINL